MWAEGRVGAFSLWFWAQDPADLLQAFKRMGLNQRPQGLRTGEPRLLGHLCGLALKERTQPGGIY